MGEHCAQGGKKRGIKHAKWVRESTSKGSGAARQL